MKKIVITIISILLITAGLTGCGKNRDNNSESPDTAIAEQKIESELEECPFDIDETVDAIKDFARGHGLRSKNRLCYRSDNHIKIDLTRISSNNDLLQNYQDAIYDIVATGNNTGADDIYFNIETVSLDEKGYFIVYITYEYEYSSDTQK